MENPFGKPIAPASAPKPSSGLFDNIICAVKLEQEFTQTKKILCSFVVLLSVSAASMPFSFAYMLNQWSRSGAGYFIIAAAQNLNLFSVLWQDIILSVLESLPVVAIIVFALNLALLIFAVRLFLHKKGLLLKYVAYNVAKIR